MTRTRVLVVDDNEILANTVKLGLEQWGTYEVEVICDPARAAATALDNPPDIILLDVIMPGRDGGSVAAEIREHPRTSSIPIVFLTSILGKDEASLKGGHLADAPVLAKPVTIEQLTEQIQKSLGRT